MFQMATYTSPGRVVVENLTRAKMRGPESKRGDGAQEEGNMKNFKDDVNAVMAALADVKIDAEKFDNGNESAGRRARVALGEVSKRCSELRRDILAVSQAMSEAKRNQASPGKKRK